MSLNIYKYRETAPERRALKFDPKTQSVILPLFITLQELAKNQFLNKTEYVVFSRALNSQMRAAKFSETGF
jgi:hypothetical protein